MGKKTIINPIGKPLDLVIDPSEDITHSELTDMPDVAGTNTDHDARYLTLNTSNDPLTGDLEISKTTPEIRLTDTEYSRLYRDSSNNFYLKNIIELAAGSGKALSFDGSSSSSATDVGLPSGAGARSISTWINVTVQSGEYSAPFSWGTQDGDKMCEVLLNSSGNVFFHAWGYLPQFTGVTANTSTWYHLVITYDGTTVKGYWNGDIKLNDNHALNTTLSGTMYFGRSCSGSPRYFNGKVDETVIFNRALSQAEVTALYNSGAGMYGNVAVPPYNSGVVSAWHFDEGTGTTTADFIGSRTVTLAGATAWVDGWVGSGGGVLTEVNLIYSNNGYNTYGNTSVPTRIGSLSTEGVVQSDTNGEITVDNTLTDITLAGTVYAEDGLITILPNISDASQELDVYPTATSGANNWSAIYVETYGSAKWLGLIADESAGITLTGSETINVDQDLTVDGDLSADNLSGTNTGDQDLGVLPIITVTDSTIAPDETYHTILCDTTSNSITINLPASSTNEGRIYVIKVVNATNSVILDPNSSETIDGATTITLTEIYESVTIQCDGSNWWTI